MDITVIFMAFLIHGLQEAKAFAVIGEEGQSVTITCVHSNAASNVKYFCKGACKDEDVLVTSNAPDQNDKYRIEDKGNTFIVTISGLTPADQGNYWCGIERAGVDTYNQVNIIVSSVDRGGSWTMSMNSLASKTLIGIGAGLGVVLLALAVVLLIFFRQRKRVIGSSQEKGKAAVYATKSIQKQGRRLDVAMATTTGKGDVRGATDYVYSNVSPQPQKEPEAMFYSTVSFNKHADCRTAAASASSTTYSSIKHSAADGSTVYSNV